jgi:hypothetical protein
MGYVCVDNNRKEDRDWKKKNILKKQVKSLKILFP